MKRLSVVFALSLLSLVHANASTDSSVDRFCAGGLWAPTITKLNENEAAICTVASEAFLSRDQAAEVSQKSNGDAAAKLCGAEFFETSQQRIFGNGTAVVVISFYTCRAGPAMNGVNK